MKKIKFFASNLLLVMMCFMFAACPEPEPDIEEGNLVNTLKKYKWQHTDVSEYNDTDYGGFWGTSTYRLYFMDNNIGYHYTVEKDHDTSLGDSQKSYFDKFTYSVSGNTVRLNFKSGQDTYTYRNGFLVLGDDSYYEPSLMTQSDKDFVNRKAQEIEEDEENEEISSNIKDYVDITYEYVEEDISIEFTINTELGKEFPGKTFKYGIEYGYGDYEYTSYCEMGGKSSQTFVMSILFAEYALYYKSYIALREKIDNGEKLTDSEQVLLEEVVYYIEKDVKKFKARYFVEYNGERFYFNAYFYDIEIDLDDSYNNSYGGGNNDNENDQTTGTTQGHAYVDLGLSVKWATCNVGASKPEDYGDYYAWGETTTKSDYSWKTYKWCKGTGDTMTKYCANSNDGTVDNRKTLTSSDDVATEIMFRIGDEVRIVPGKAKKDGFEEPGQLLFKFGIMFSSINSVIGIFVHFAGWLSFIMYLCDEELSIVPILMIILTMMIFLTKKAMMMTPRMNLRGTTSISMAMLNIS